MIYWHTLIQPKQNQLFGQNKMNFTETTLKGAYVIEPIKLIDERGGFSRTFCKEEFKNIKHTKEFVQFNQSFNLQKGTIRGMHFQQPPFCEIKLIRCIKGSVYDVIVDIRNSSPTFLQWFGIELSDLNMKMIYVPEGFAHGFQTLEDNSELLYHHTNFYVPSSEKGIRYNDEMINIHWPLAVSMISEKDKSYPLLTNSFKGITI